MNQITSPPRFLAAIAGMPIARPERPRIALGRRGFLTAGAALGGGLLLNMSVPRRSRAGGSGSTVNIFVVINADESVTIIAPGAEMGQGINAGLAHTLSEELPLDWTKVRTTSAPWGVQYSNYGSQVTGGSYGMRSWFQAMLTAGATAREMLLAAALSQYPAAPTPLTAKDGMVVDAKGMPVATYGQLAPAAALLAPPASPPRYSASGYSVVGKAKERPDIRTKVDGSAKFGIDIRVPGMVFGVVRHCPTMGGTVATVPAAPAGTQVVNLGNAIAVTAANTWLANNTARKLGVTWTLPSSSAQGLVDTSTLSSNAASLMSSGAAAVAEAMPSGLTAAAVTTAINGSAKKLNLTYSLPLLAHACMEVLNCTVQLMKDTSGAVTAANVWCPTQAPDWVAGTVAALIPALKLPSGAPDPARIAVTTTLLGGGLGRKIEQDFVAQAVKVALAVNAPVKLTWPREEDFGRDWYRPSALSRVQIGLDATGKITGWYNRIVAPSCLRSHGWAPPPGTPGFVDGIAVGSAAGNGGEPMPYAANLPTRLIEYVEQQTGFNIGFWRSVGQSISCFVVESAIDEIAKALNVDPYSYRRGLLPAGSPALAVLDAAWNLAVANTTGGAPVLGSTAWGVALSPGFGSLAAQVAEVALVKTSTTSSTGVVTTTTAYKVTRVFCAVDCGFAVNPDEVVAQMEGGILHGMNAARWGRVQFDHGICQVQNFGDYRMGRMADTPKIFVKVISDPKANPGGVGEVGVPAVAPAIANAYAALTGTRKRSLPLGF